MKVLFPISAKITLWCVVITFFAGASVAQTTESLDRLFTIKAIKVDETARRASDAQRTALAKAELEAFDKLLLKITQPEGRASLPEISVAEKQSLISGLEIVEESSSSRRYTATLNVRFEPAVVSEFLARYHVPHVLSAGRGVVVFYGHEDGLNEFLWQKDTNSQQAITSVDWVNRIRNYSFPEGVLSERALISYQEIKELDLGKRDRLLDFYNVPSVLFIHSAWDAQKNSLSYKFKLSDNDMNGNGQVTAAYIPEAQVKMFEEILDQIDSVWRSQLLVDTGQSGEISVLLETTALEDLVAIEKKLADVTLVQNVTVDEIGLPFSRISFSYTGREDQLIVALKFSGLSLDEYGTERLLKAIR